MSETATPTNNSPQTSEERPKCGIVMPISEIDGLSESHWADVLTILSAAIQDAGFEPNLVSTTEEVGIIQKTIIQNLYDNPMVVCDVSGKNPNVMFELGMRLAFDRPTVIVKDDKTSYTFDTASIQHVNYPRDLRFNQIVDFKAKLSSRVKNTHQRASTDPDYTTFLKHFGEFKVAKIDKTEVSGEEFIIEELQNLRQSIARLERSTQRAVGSGRPARTKRFTYPIKKDVWKKNSLLRDFVKTVPDARIMHTENEVFVQIPAVDETMTELVKILDAETASKADSIRDALS